MGSFRKRLKKTIKLDAKKQASIIYGNPNVDAKYKKYCWTEDQQGQLPKVNPTDCIYILEKYYDIFQYILDRLREKQIRFILFPIELYGEITGELVGQEFNGRITDGTNFLMDEKHNVHAICVKQYINNLYDLMVLAHEVGHIYYDHKVKQEAGADYIKVNYRYEYDADMFSINVLSYFGYLYDEQYLKLKEKFQIEFMINTKLLPEEFYDEYKKILNLYDRETNGLLSDKIAKIFKNKQLDGSEFTNMLPQIINEKSVINIV